MARLELKIVESPSLDLGIYRYSSEHFPEFQELFAARDWETKNPLQHLLRKPNEDQVSVVLQNNSSKDITILSARWQLPDFSSKPMVRGHNWSSYGVNVFTPMLTAGERVLLSPLSACVKESLLAHVKAGGGTITARFSSSRDPELPEVGAITFAIDLVGFDDGEIAGPDPDRFAAKVRDRKRAAEYIAQQIRQAESENRDPRPVLQALTELPRRREDFFLCAVHDFARDYMKIRDFPSPQQRLLNLENLVGPPRFFRREASSGSGNHSAP